MPTRTPTKIRGRKKEIETVTSVDLVITKEIRIEAPPQTVFPFFTEPDQIVRWSGTEADLDPTPGGIYKVQMTPEALALGEYVEVTPYSRGAGTAHRQTAFRRARPPSRSTSKPTATRPSSR
jgi:hypothetical protein